MTDEELKAKLAAARQALGGNILKKKEIQAEAISAKQKEAAARAMEGPEFKAKREAQKREAAQRELARRIHEEEARRRQEEEQRKKEEEHQLELAREEAEALEQQTREQLAAQSVRVIDQLRQSPTVTINPIKTLKTDLTDAVKDRRVTLAQIVLRQKKQENDEPEKINRYVGPTIAVITSVILILAGIGFTIFAYYRYYKSGPRVETIRPLPGAFFADEFLDIPLDGSITTVTATQKFRTAVNNGGSRSSNIVSLTPTLNGEILKLEKFDELLGLKLSLPLITRVDETFFLGTFAEQTGQRTLWYVFTVKDYEQTLASFLDGEYEIFRSLFGPVWTPEIQAIARDIKFQNSVTANQTSRGIKAADGRVVAIWGFVGRETLVLAGSDKTFRAVVERLGLPESLPRR